MKITNEFAVTVPIERAWAVLTDLEGLAPCLPGAQLTGVDGDVYQGRVRVKVGPVVSEFAGTARFVEKDDAAHRGVIDAKGRDARSTGTASALVTAHLRPDGDRTLVSVDTDLKISGKLAQFGSGMIKEVSGKLLAQFVANLEAKLAAEPPAPHPNADPVAATSAAQPEPTPATSESTPAASAAPPEPTPAASATAVATTPSTAAVAPSPVEPSPVTPSPDGTSSVSPRPASPPPVAPTAVGASAVEPSADGVRVAPTAEPEALDLLSIAGGSVTKRLVPVLVGLVAVGAVITWLVARR
ncbi:carbon monoxide dehydrogenase subunit G [Micromonospora vinacea]|uniref:Carbon monoxide dehydrogenase subunit G n=1 Tax=Micromonospora vinacea TaxID=709878 RepID=A0ABS0K9B2_9ACTN|nr:SRPBCC family protein [Micromonospora vinacea]MBG6105228.1 carbon monoxide dehydrogenase subunit G [Micromonospora vinacea]